MSHKKTMVVLTITAFLSLITSVVSAHHMAPDDLEDFITDQLIVADSPHLLSSDDDPTLLDIMVEGMDDVDYVIVTDGLSANEVTTALEDILERLAREDDVCDVKYIIEYDATTQTFTLTVYIDYCSE